MSRLIRQSGAELVWVGLSTPKQERWMDAMIDRLQGPIVSFGVGAAFDINAELRSDAPQWMRRSGLHWLYRLLQEPRRLWRRYLTNNPSFVARILARRPRAVPSNHIGSLEELNSISPPDSAVAPQRDSVSTDPRSPSGNSMTA